jgi:hypothetical protein
MQCKQCQEELPEHAKFCLHCGAPVVPEEPQQPQLPAPQAPLPDLDFVQPALTGGMFLGLLSSIPFISAGNCLCCMWVLLGGGIAVVLLTKQRPITSISYGDGAFAGVMSGLFGAVVGTVVQMSFHALAARYIQSQQQQLEDILNKLGAEGPMRDWVLRVASGEISAVTLLFTFFTNLLVFALFAMIGGILAVALLNKRLETTRSRGN